MLAKKFFRHRLLFVALGVLFSGSLNAKTPDNQAHESCSRPNSRGLFSPLSNIEKSGLPIPANSAARLMADTLDGKGGEQVFARGRVILERADTILNTDSLHYNSANGEISSDVPFRLQKARFGISGLSLRYNTLNDIGEAQQPKFLATTDQQRIQGEGKSMQMLGKNYYRLEQARLNTCQANDDSWYIQAARIDTDHQKNIGVAHNARLVFKGVPIIYTPWLDFPLNSTRKSGLLSPSFGAGSNGFELTTPYYLNLAAHYDATLTPHYYSRRGLGLGAQLRYLGNHFRSQLDGFWLPNDRLRHQSRHDVHATHQQKINDHIDLGIDYHRASDDNFYRDLGSRTSSADKINLNQQAWVRYQSRLWGGPLHAQLSIQRYQTLQNKEKNLSEPYRLMPRLEADWHKRIGNSKVSLMTQITRFAHPTEQEGTREVFNPYIEWDFNNSWAYVRPKAALHATAYQLRQRNANEKRNFTRILPIFSVDSGLTFEREFAYRGKSYLQTLEPRMFYTYIPTRGQNHLPNFDSSENSFNFDQLFRSNRFSGHDRINAANQISTSLSSRFFDRNSGIERFRAGIGQRFYLKRDEVDLSGNIHERSKNQSDFLAYAQGNITNSISLRADWHYDKNQDRSESYTTALRYHPQKGKTISLRFGYDRHNEQYSQQTQELKYLDIGVQWPIRKQYYLLARQNYSLTDKKALDQMIGIAYRSDCDCWNANLLFQRYVTDINETKNAFFFQLQFKGLGGVSNHLDEEARLAVPGYNTIEEVNQR